MKVWPKVEDVIRGLPTMKTGGRNIDYIILHHTWSPNHSQWKGDRSADGILRYWLSESKKKGWSNPLGAHWIVSPSGKLYLPFTLDRIVYANADGEMNRYGIAIELVGNFDKDRDELKDPQAHAAFGLVGALLYRFNLPSDAVRFHREFSPKTCPGTSLDLAECRRKAAAGKAWAASLMRPVL